jgi:WD40 repeat protein
MPPRLLALLAVCLALPPGQPAHSQPPTAQGKRPPPEGATRTDRYGDPLPDGVLARLGTARWRPGWQPGVLAYSPDGALVASDGDDPTIRIWEAATGREVRTLWGHRRWGVMALAFDPDGKTLASGGMDKTVRLWSVATGKQLRCLTGHPNLVGWVAFADAGTVVVSASQDGTVFRWNTATGKELGRFRLPTGFLPVGLAPDGSLFAAGDIDDLHPTFRLWDVAAGKEVGVLAYARVRGSPATFTPDGKTLAISFGGRLFLWKTGIRDEPRSFPIDGFGGYALAFSPDAKALAVEGEGQVIRPRDVATGKVLRSFRGHQHNIRALAFSPNGRTLVSTGAELTIRSWDVRTGKQIQAGVGPQGYLSSLAVSPDGTKVLAGGLDPAVWLWESRTGKLLRQLEWMPNVVALCTAFSADGRTAAAGGGSGVVRVWDVTTGRQLHEFKEGSPVHGLAFSRDGKTLFGAGEGISRWDLASGKQGTPLRGHTNFVCSLVLSPDGKTLLSAGLDRTIRLWDAVTGTELRCLRGHTDFVRTAAFSPDNRTVASISLDGTIRLWSAATGMEERRWRAAYGDSLTFSADGKHLAAASYRLIRFWEVATGRELRPLVGHHGHVERVAFSGDGKLLASAASDSTVLIWDADRLLRKGIWQRVVLSPEEWEAHWAELADQQDWIADDAQALLSTGSAETVMRLHRHLAPAPPDARHLDRLISDLADPSAEVRAQAEKHLQELGPRAEPGLRRALAGPLDPDAGRRVQRILGRVRPEDLAAHARREVRAVHLLEQIDEREARQLLQTLADGPATSPVTKEAKASLERLARRPAAKP